MNKDKNDFLLFQKEFKKYQERFGLSGYRVYFKHKPLDGSFAHIDMRPTDRVATVTLNSKLEDEEKPFKDIKTSARHEALHLLIYGLEDLAKSRYIQEWMIDEISEELVNKLEKLIE